jgi:streptogramin lyase
MPRPPSPPFLLLALALLSWSGAIGAGGSNYGVKPGAVKEVAGTVREWPVPTPSFARDPAPAPDGNIYIAVMQGNRIARFDTATEQFTEWELPRGARPHGLVVDEAGIVWYTGNGNGSIGRLDPKSGKVTEYKLPGGGDPHTIVLDPPRARCGSPSRTVSALGVWIAAAARSTSSRWRATPTAWRSTARASSGSAAWPATRWAGSIR